MINEKKIIKLLEKYFKNEIISPIFIIKEIQYNIFQYGFENGLVDNINEEYKLQEKILIEIFSKEFSRYPNNNELSLLITIAKRSKLVYQEGFNEGKESKKIFDKFKNI